MKGEHRLISLNAFKSASSGSISDNCNMLALACNGITLCLNALSQVTHDQCHTNMSQISTEQQQVIATLGNI